MNSAKMYNLAGYAAMSRLNSKDFSKKWAVFSLTKRPFRTVPFRKMKFFTFSVRKTIESGSFKRPYCLDDFGSKK